MSNKAGRRGSVGPDRGDLRIYLGAAPGVGKTFAMLGEAHRRQERGCDVVAGVVETHGRARTAGLLEGIEQIPLRTIQYRGSTAHELDVAAIIERNPSLVLVDELAHTNTPGSTHEKRWQDVEELLDAGIDVVSTLNVQHLESLNDVVEQITGVPQRETVPDSVVRGAEQIELVDVAPEALRRRLSHGNIYAAEKVDAALSNYFRQGNLTALRELSLLWIADQVDAALTKYRSSHDITDTWETRERVVVSVTGGPESETLLRRASRIASKSSAELMVLHVIRGDGMAGVSAPQMGKVRKLAASLGASMHSVVGDDVPSTLLEFARGANATQLVIGTSRRSRWARIMDAGIGATVIQHSGKIDVHMVTHAEISRGWRIARLVPTQRRILSWAAAVIVPFVSALAMLLVDPYLDLGGESALFFMVVLGVALLGGVAPAALSALIAGLLLNYFFADPRHSFTIAEPDNFVTTVVLLIMAVAVAFLVDSAARRTVQARRASQEAELLTLFAGTVLRGGDIRTLLDRVRETYSQRAVSIIRAEGSVVESVGEDPPAEPDDADTAIETADGTFTLLLSGSKTGAHDRRVLSAVANQAMGLIRQSELALEASKAAGLAEADRLRRALLSAVSHDLRTPLAAVKASVSSLRSTDVEFSPEDTAELLTTIEESTDQLTGLVGNLLDSSRLAAGVITPSSTVVYVEDSVSAALASSSAAAGSRERVIVDVGDVAVAADVGLLERVMANLIDNALRHAPGTPVRVGATYAGSRALITVSDSGPGIARGTEEAVFEAFQRLGDSDNTTGVGLGLSVVRGFVEAMKGAVTISETAGGGVTMTVELASAASLTNDAVAQDITNAASRE